MSKNAYANLFKKILSEAVEDVKPYDPTKDAEAFKETPLGKNVSPDEMQPKINTENLDAPVKAIVAWIDRLEEIRQELINPTKSDSFITQLGQLSSVPEYAEAHTNLTKVITAAANAISEVGNAISGLVGDANARAGAATSIAPETTPAQPPQGQKPQKPVI